MPGPGEWAARARAAAGLTLWPQSPQWTRTCKGAQGKGAAPPLRPPMQQQGSSCMWRETMWGALTWPPWPSQVLQTHSITLHANSCSLQKLLSIIARNMQPLAFKMSRQAYLTGSKKHIAGQTQLTGAKQGVGDGSTPALGAMNSLTPSSNSTVTCLSPKEKSPSAGYS